MNMHQIIKGKYDATGALLDAVKVEHAEWIKRRDAKIRGIALRYWHNITDAESCPPGDITDNDFLRYIDMLWKGLSTK